MLTLAALSALAALSVPAAAVADPAPPIVRSAEVPREVREYWTPERMRQARPAAELLGAEAADAASSERSAAAATRARTPRRRFGVGDPSIPPWRMHGKVFFTIPGQGDFTCSGTSVRSNSHSLVVAAGHCVYDVGVFARNWVFAPGFSNGDAPFGRWPAEQLAAPRQWVNGGDLRYDVGMAIVRRDEQRRGLQDVVGGHGIAFNQPRNQFYTAVGYPAQQPPFEFTGGRMFACTSTYRGADNGFASPRPMRIACDMNAGSSGGGWVVNDKVLSVSSYKILFESQNLYGPYFGGTIENMYRAFQGKEMRCGRWEVTHLGTSGRDVIRGTPKRDVIAGLGGNDLLRGRGGNDIICAGKGRDRIFGGAGNDRLAGQNANDRISGGRDIDRCRGGRGRDRFAGCERARRR